MQKYKTKAILESLVGCKAIKPGTERRYTYYFQKDWFKEDRFKENRHKHKASDSLPEYRAVLHDYCFKCSARSHLMPSFSEGKGRTAQLITLCEVCYDKY